MFSESLQLCSLEDVILKARRAVAHHYLSNCLSIRRDKNMPQSHWRCIINFICNANSICLHNKIYLISWAATTDTYALKQIGEFVDWAWMRRKAMPFKRAESELIFGKFYSSVRAVVSILPRKVLREHLVFSAMDVQLLHYTRNVKVHCAFKIGLDDSVVDSLSHT